MASPPSHWNDLDDSSSVRGSLFSASTDSTLSFTHGPGALTGGFLKIFGEKSLDLLVRVVIRSRLTAIERTLETTPHVFYNPTEDKEWKTMLEAYRDLRELCREFRSDYYPPSFQSTAARLVRDITNAIQSSPQDSFTKDLAGVGRWEELLARVQNRWEIVVTRTVETFDSPHHEMSGIPDVSDQRPSISNKGSGLEIPPADGARRYSRQYSEGKRKELLPIPPFPTRKVLVLGASAVGKSTLLEQIIETFRSLPFSRVNPYSPLSRGEKFFTSNDLRDVIKTYVNPSDLAKDTRHLFTQIIDKDYCFPRDEFRDAISTLWNDPVVRQSVLKSRTTNQSQSLGGSLSLESTCYFLDNAHRIYKADYHPTHEDRIRGKYVPTNGIWQYWCHDGSNGSDWLFVDIGGTRLDRKKWVYSSGGSPAVLFVVALSDYNKRLPEDPKVNKLKDSLYLFYSVLDSKWFEDSLMVLFLNKVDLFSQALQSSPLQDYGLETTTKDHFPPWYSDQFSTCEEELVSVGSLFRSLAEKRGKEIHVVYGSAVNSHTTKESWQFIKDKIDEAHQNF